MVLIDNDSYAFAYNIENGVPIKDFNGDKNDVELLNVIEYLK